MRDKRRTPRRPAEAESDKDHSTFFFQRAAFPQRDALPTDLEAAWEELARESQHPLAKWKCAGPFNIAGRVTSLAVHPKKWSHLFAGTAGGGVWRSRNGGKKWTPCRWPQAASSSIGALAVDPHEPSTLLAATGEANLSADTYPGTGFYFSRDGGETWEDYFTTPDGKPIPKEQRPSIPRRVGTIALDPFGIVLGAVGGISLDGRMPAGLYLLDKPQSIIPAPGLPNRTYNCHSVAFHPKEEGTIFAALEPRGALNGIWCKRGRDNIWMLELQNGLPSGERFGRASIAISPSGVMFVLAADRRRRLLGVFRSDTTGRSWTQIAFPEHFPDERFMHYNNTIVVHPDNPDFVIWGGQSLYRTRDGGATWDQITRHFRSAKDYVHEDHHALVMPHGDLIYSGNDGGVAVCQKGAEDKLVWEERSRGMVTTMFYDVDVAAGSKVFGGGAQDNGTLVTGVDGLKGGDFVQAFRGDGGWLVFDPTDSQRAFGSIQNLGISSHRRGRDWTTWDDRSPKDIPPGEAQQRAIAVLAMGPGKRKGTKTVWTGTHRLWRTDDDGVTWKPKPEIESPFDGSVISAIEISSLDPELMFVGTTAGGIFRSTDGGESWSEDLASFEMPRKLVTRIETHPSDPGVVAIAISSTGLPGGLLAPEGKNATFMSSRTRIDAPFEKSWSSIFWSEDRGLSWEDVDQGLLPNVVFYALAFETRGRNRLFVAGDAGVFVKLDAKKPDPQRFHLGRHVRHQTVGWLSITGNMPNVVVSDLVYHKDRILTAATYGRGIWRLRTDRLDTEKFVSG